MLFIIGHNTKCCICIFSTFQEKQKTGFYLSEWFFCFNILNMHIKYDKKWYPSIHSMFHALCNPPIMVKFQCSSSFLPQYLLLFNPDSDFCSLILSQMLMACNERCSHKLLQRNSPSKQNVFDSKWQDIHDVSAADTAFWIKFQIRYFVIIYNLNHCFLWFLIG